MGAESSSEAGLVSALENAEHGGNTVLGSAVWLKVQVRRE